MPAPPPASPKPPAGREHASCHPPPGSNLRCHDGHLCATITGLSRPRRPRMLRWNWVTKAFMADYDLAIIGGGINGAGIARDAAGRGLRVLLLEQNDLGSGTS